MSSEWSSRLTRYWRHPTKPAAALHVGPGAGGWGRIVALVVGVVRGAGRAADAAVVAEDQVVALVAVDDVVAAAAEQDVVERAAVDRVVAAVGVAEADRLDDAAR